MSRIGKSIETESRLVVVRGWGVMGMIGFLIRGNESILKLNSGDNGTVVLIHKNYWMVH